MFLKCWDTVIDYSRYNGLLRNSYRLFMFVLYDLFKPWVLTKITVATAVLPMSVSA